jgi:hypothetical protein
MVAAEPKTVALTSGAIGLPSSWETSAPGTWLAEVPRICRTASRTSPRLDQRLERRETRTVAAAHGRTGP